MHGLLAHDVEGGDEPERPGIVHRLDRDTSGLLVVARSPEAHRRLQELVQRARADARVPRARRRPPALASAARSTRRSAATGSDALRHSLDTDTPREAVTHFEVEELLARHALLRVTLETGRTHQIRVHLAAIDLPVAGDPIYGVAGELGLDRQFLHAARLAFEHPLTRRAGRRRVAAAARPRAALGARPREPPARLPAIPSHDPADHAGARVPASAAGAPRAPPEQHQSNRRRSYLMAVASMRELLEAGVHFGHQTRRWNPKMRRFIFTERSGIYIIDLTQTSERLDEAAQFVRNLAERNGTVLFVGTKKQAQDAVENEAKRVGMPYVNHRWLGGLLTNWRTMSDRIERLHEMRRLRDEGQMELLPAKERISMAGELEKLEANLGGVADMRKQPDAVFIIDLKKEAARGARGAPARPAGDRARRHELPTRTRPTTSSRATTTRSARAR